MIQIESWRDDRLQADDKIMAPIPLVQFKDGLAGCSLIEIIDNLNKSDYI